MPVHTAGSGRHRSAARGSGSTLSFPAAPAARPPQRAVGRHRSQQRDHSSIPLQTLPRWGAVVGIVAGLMLAAVAQAPAVQQGRALASLQQHATVSSAVNFSAPARAVTLITAPKAPDPRVLLDQASRSAIRDPKGAARIIALQTYGWNAIQFTCLDQLWTRESRWNYRAENPSSGAYGIPQALPGSKMASVGSDWRTNPVTQIKWGLGYIKGRYGNPCAAWGHSESHGWY